MNWLYYFFLMLLMLTGLGITLMNLPGLWLMAAAAGLYAMITPEHYLWPWGIVTVLALCVIGEILELFGKAAGAKQAGGSNRAMLFATLGGIGGGLLLSIPVPIIGTIAGVCIGAFAGAMIAQLTVASDVGHSAIVGFGAAKGTLYGLLMKVAVGCVIFIVAAWLALPFGRTVATSTPTLPAPIPATMPTTLPDVESN